MINKNSVQKILSIFKKIKLELLSFIILMLWAISPIIEYFFKKYCSNTYYTHYFTNIIYLIGILGILIYIFYFIKLNKKENNKIKYFIPEILIIALLNLSLIASFLSDNSYLSFFGESYRKEGLIVYIMYIGFILLSSIIKDNKYIKYLFLSMIISCLVITIMPLFDKYFTYLNYTNIFHNPNHYGYYLMINTMLSLFMFINSNKLYKKILYILSYIFILYLLIKNNTFGSYLAMCITLFFLFIYSLVKKYEIKKVLLVIILFISTSFIISNYDIKIGERVNFNSTKGIVSANMSSLSQDIKGFVNKDEKAIEAAGTYRGLLWKEAGKYALKHPLFGGGMECLKKYYYNECYIFYSDRPHNMILQISAFIGIPGALVYLALIIYLAISNLKIMKKNSIHIMVYFSAMCYFISSLFGNSMYYTSPYFMILLGLLIGFIRYNKIKSNN